MGPKGKEYKNPLIKGNHIMSKKDIAKEEERLAKEREEREARAVEKQKETIKNLENKIRYETIPVEHIKVLKKENEKLKNENNAAEIHIQQLYKQISIIQKEMDRFCHREGLEEVLLHNNSQLMNYIRSRSIPDFDFKILERNEKTGDPIHKFKCGCCQGYIGYGEDGAGMCKNRHFIHPRCSESPCILCEFKEKPFKQISNKDQVVNRRLT